MQFTLYTEKTIPQCSAALNERMQAKPTSTRRELQGWIEKGGRFSLAVTSKVFGSIARTTRLTGVMQREAGITVIRGYVSDGVSPQWQKILAVVLLIVCAILLLGGQAVLALISLLMGGAAYVPFRGDYENSETLLIELERTLKASPKQPAKKPTAARSAAPKPAAVVRSAPAKPAAPNSPNSAAKPQPKSTPATPARPSVPKATTTPTPAKPLSRSTSGSPAKPTERRGK